MNKFTIILISTKKENKEIIKHNDILNELKSTIWKDYNINFENNITLFENNENNNFIISKNEINTNLEYNELNNKLGEWFEKKEIDFYFNYSKHFNNDNRKLAVFDMDSCIIKNECIDEMASIMGVSERVSDITLRAMKGELDFNQALAERLSLLEGMTIDQLEQVWENIELNPGSFSLISALKSFGFKTALVSGGFSYFAYRVASRLGMDYAVSNTLEFTNDNDGHQKTLTGKVIGNIVNGEMKKSMTIFLQNLLNLQQNQIISMGDGSNDKLMIQYSDMGIAFHGKPILKAATPFQINFGPLNIASFYLPNLFNQPSPSTSLIDIITNKKHIYQTSIHQLGENQALVNQYNEFKLNYLKK